MKTSPLLGLALVASQLTVASQQLEQPKQTSAAVPDARQMHMAARSGQTERVTKLLEQKPDLVNAKGQWTSTPLHQAARMGHAVVAEGLISHGANVNAKLEQEIQKSKGILEHAFDGTTTKIFAGDSPLHWAAQCEKTSVLELLISKGAAIDAENEVGHTALHTACFTANRNAAELLLGKGAKVNLKDKKEAALSLAQVVADSPTRGIQVFGAWRAITNAFTGGTPLHAAALCIKSDIAQLLIQKGAVIDAKNELGYTPLHIASALGNNEVVECLLLKGAELNAKDNENNTPKDLARASNRAATIVLLEKIVREKKPPE